MFPILFSAGSLTVYTASLIMVIGFVISLFHFWKLARVDVIEEEKVFDFVLFSLLGAFFFGRLIFVIEHAVDFRGFFDRIIHLYRFPGFNSWGLIFGTVFVGLMYVYKNRLPKRRIFDYFAVSLALFLTFLFLGFLFNGTYCGAVSEQFGVTFVGMSGKRVPLQIFVSLLFFVFFLFFRREIDSKRKEKVSHNETGYIFWLFTAFTFLIFLILEFLRHDTLYFEEVGVNKFLYFVVFLASISIFVVNYQFLIKRKIKKLLKL